MLRISVSLWIWKFQHLTIRYWQYFYFCKASWVPTNWFKMPSLLAFWSSFSYFPRHEGFWKNFRTEKIGRATIFFLSYDYTAINLHNLLWWSGKTNIFNHYRQHVAGLNQLSKLYINKNMNISYICQDELGLKIVLCLLGHSCPDLSLKVGNGTFLISIHGCTSRWIWSD